MKWRGIKVNRRKILDDILLKSESSKETLNDLKNEIYNVDIKLNQITVMFNYNVRIKTRE